MNSQSTLAGRAEALAFLLSEYAVNAKRFGPVRAQRELRDRLAALPPAAALECANALSQRGDSAGSRLILEDAVARAPEYVRTRSALADALCGTGDLVRAEQLISKEAAAGEPSALSTLAKVRRNQGRLAEAVKLMRAAAPEGGGDPDMTLYCAEFLRDCQQHAAALDLLEGALKETKDARITALAGQLALALGHFDRARTLLRDSIDRGADLNRWFVAQALADCRRFKDPADPDLALLQELLGSPKLDERARASVLFGLAKIHDDLGDIETAAREYREANETAARLTPWSRERWTQFAEQQLARAPLPEIPENAQGGAPAFVVGMPRSGTTLVAEMLGRHPDVRNRGETHLVGFVRQWLEPRSADPGALEFARTLFRTHLLQDDAPAAWYIDKNPLNFRFLNLIQALAPRARIIWCRRDPRDVALSIWKQFFARADNGYAFDFQAIADMSNDSERMMRHWQRTLKLPILEMPYESLVADPAAAARAMTDFLDLPAADLLDLGQARTRPIATASVWQARQPVYQSSVAKWREYAPYVPELERYFPN